MLVHYSSGKSAILPLEHAPAHLVKRAVHSYISKGKTAPLFLLLIQEQRVLSPNERVNSRKPVTVRKSVVPISEFFIESRESGFWIRLIGMRCSSDLYEKVSMKLHCPVDLMQNGSVIPRNIPITELENFSTIRATSVTSSGLNFAFIATSRRSTFHDLSLRKDSLTSYF